MEWKFTKPKIRFPSTSFFMLKTRMEYEKITTYSGVINFVMEKIQEIETKHSWSMEKENLKQIAYPLYSIITGRSYESKIKI